MNSAHKSLSQMYEGKNPIQIPAYTASEAAKYLDVPRATARSWAFGQKNFKSIIRLADTQHGLLSFQNLIEIHVLSALRKKHEIRLPAVRKAIEYLKSHLQTEHPLSDAQLLTDNHSVFIEEYGKLINASKAGQLEMKGVLDIYLKRIERDRAGIPIRLYPFTTTRPNDQSRFVVIDPRVQFGRPCITGTGIPTNIIAERYKAGDSIAYLAEDYGRKPSEIEEALRYEFPAVVA